MAHPANDMPTQSRSDSEIAFVLREAKWRRGPEVLRDLARGNGEHAGPAEAPRAKPKAKAPGRAARPA